MWSGKQKHWPRKRSENVKNIVIQGRREERMLPEEHLLHLFQKEEVSAVECPKEVDWRYFSLCGC